MRTLLTADELREGVTRMSREIVDTYGDCPLTILGVMTGSIVLVADLIRRIDIPLRVGVVQARSYRGASTQRGPLVINSDLMPDIEHRDVLVVDDIFDTGHTLVELIRLLDSFNPRSVRTAVLLRKRGRQEVELEPDFVGFEIPNEFVVGYGLDFRDEYRDLPHVAILEENELP